jgi:hypothetical protein
MTQTIVFDPLVPMALLIAAAVVVFAGLILSVWRPSSLQPLLAPACSAKNAAT